jgi:hypothetical protein
MPADSLTLTVPVAGGRLAPSEAQKQTIAAFLAKRDGKAVEVKLAKPTANRSQQQNRLYWSCVIGTLAESTGNNPEDLHLVLKDMFLPRKFLKLGAREVEVVKTTRDLSVTEFTDYIRRIQAWAAAELGITIPRFCCPDVSLRMRHGQKHSGHLTKSAQQPKQELRLPSQGRRPHHARGHQARAGHPRIPGMDWHEAAVLLEIVRPVSGLRRAGDHGLRPLAKLVRELPRGHGTATDSGAQPRPIPGRERELRTIELSVGDNRRATPEQEGQPTHHTRREDPVHHGMG